MITFYADNLVDQATITASSENALFPLTNITDPRRTKVFRSAANTTTIVFDALETSEIDTIIVVDHPNIGFGFSTMLVEINGTDEWSSPAYSSAMTLSVRHGVGILEIPTVQNYRFVRITLTSVLGYCELSKIFIGKKILTDRGISYGWTNKDDDLSIIKENRFGQKFVDIIGRQKIFSGSIKNLDDDNIDMIRNVTDTKGKTKPFFVKIGCTDAMSDPLRFVAMVFFTNIPNETNRFYKNWGMSLQFEEAK